jgi:hypothetical protein
MDDDVAKLIDKLEIVTEAFPLPIYEDGRVMDRREGRG